MIRLLVTFALAASGSGLVSHAQDEAVAVEDHEERFPAWSPDGKRIAFVSDRGQPGIFHLYIADADGSNLTALTKGDTTADWPVWSQDGMWIYFDSRKEGRTEILRVPSTGGEAVQLTEIEGASNSHASASAKGGLIAFDSNREADGLRKVYSMAHDGTKVRLMTINPHSNSFPAWSPDGELIAFAMRKSTFSPVSEIHVIKSDGTGLKQLTKLGVASTQPAWSPDGTRVIFVAVVGGNREICVTGIDGASVERLTENDRNEMRPSFSPDGTKILFCADEGGRFRIFTMNADGSEVSQISFVSETRTEDTPPSQ